MHCCIPKPQSLKFRTITIIASSIKFFIIWAASWQNQQNDLCAQQRLRSAWASAQSDQSLRCPHEESLGSLATHWAHHEDSDQTGKIPRLIWVFAGCTVILLVLSWGGSFFKVSLTAQIIDEDSPWRTYPCWGNAICWVFYACQWDCVLK